MGGLGTSHSPYTHVVLSTCMLTWALRWLCDFVDIASRTPCWHVFNVRRPMRRPPHASARRLLADGDCSMSVPTIPSALRCAAVACAHHAPALEGAKADPI